MLSASDGGDDDDSDESDDGEWKRLWDLGLVLSSPSENNRSIGEQVDSVSLS